MGWKGTLRSVVAASRAMEREARRREKQFAKDQIIADAADAVADWEDYIYSLTSLHTDLANKVNWAAIARSPRPAEPSRSPKSAKIAEAALAAFKPGFFDFLKGGSESRRRRLEDAVANARAKDEADQKRATTEFLAAMEEWEKDAGLAKRILANEPEAFREVISELQSLTDIAMIGTAVSFSISASAIHAMPEVHGTDIVPDVRRKQLASGKLSETKLPVSHFNELYQDYVASAALRVAGDVFQILPIDTVYVTCMSHMLNSATGHQEMTPILSVQFVRESFSRLRLDDIDPSDSLVNFNHAMKFKKTKGFEAVVPLMDIHSA